MDTLLTVLHVVGAVFIVGPMAILPMSAMRALRGGNNAQVTTLAKSTRIFTLLSLVVFLLGFGVLGMADPKYNVSVTTPWVLWSIIVYVIALALSLFLVVPAMTKAATATATGGTTSGYPAIGAGSGVVALLLVAVVVLMVWKP